MALTSIRVGLVLETVEQIMDVIWAKSRIITDIEDTDVSQSLGAVDMPLFERVLREFVVRDVQSL